MGSEREQAMDDFVEAQVEQALARHEGKFPPEALEEMRRLLRLGLRTHPAAREVVRRLTTQIPKESGTTSLADAGEGGEREGVK